MRKEIKSSVPADIYKEIEEIYNGFMELQREAFGILDTNKVPDSSAQLNDVLKSTEEATNIILDSATSISGIAETACSSDEGKTQIAALVNKIYEACTFQDITGQRIKKVLKNLNLLEQRLANLSAIARNNKSKSVKTESHKDNSKNNDNSLLNGPQLSAEAPTQEDIDKLFAASKKI